MALALDGSNSFGGPGGGSGTSASISLTTTNSNDVIIVWAFCEQASAGAISVTSVTASGLQFAKRSAVQIVNTGTNQTWDLECWWAVAKSPLSAVSITVNFSSSSVYNALWAFGVSGCPTPNNPWDPNSSLPAYTSSGTGTTAPVISTTRAHDMLINCDVESASGAGTPAAGSGWTIIASVANSYELVQYDVVSATQSSLTIPVGAGVSGNIIVSVGDALTADNPPLFIPLTSFDPVVRKPTFTPYQPIVPGIEAIFIPPPTTGGKQIILTSGTSWTVPSDWNNANNTIEGIGAGLNGSSGGTENGASAGPGGCYAKKSNFVATPGASISYQIGTANGTTGAGTSPTANTWFNNASTLIAAGGASSTANCVGSLAFAGGAAGGGSGSAGGGGGGAAGPYAAGNAGATPGNGGQGDGTHGGTGGTGGSSAGSPGTEWGTVGAGGGGGGGTLGSTGFAGGLYGAGGGGGGGANQAGGAGTAGLIVITYQPMPPVISVPQPDPLPGWLARRAAAYQAAQTGQAPGVEYLFFPPPVANFGWFQLFRDPVRAATRPGAAWFTGIEGSFVPPIPVLSTFWQQPRDPVRAKVPVPPGWFTGIEAPFQFIPPLAFYSPFLDPVRRISGHAAWPYEQSVGIEASFVRPIPPLAFYSPFLDPVRRISGHAAWPYREVGTEAPLVPTPPPLAFYSPFLDPVRRISGHATWPNWAVGIENVFTYFAPPLLSPAWWAEQHPQPVRLPSGHATWPGVGQAPGIELPYVYVPLPYPPFAFYSPFLDPVRARVPVPQGWFTGIEGSFVPPIPPLAFYSSFLDPIRAKVPRPWDQFVGTEYPFVKPIPSLAFYQDFRQPVLRRVPVPPSEFFYPPAPFVYIAPSGPPYVQIPFIFPIPLFFVDTPQEELTDWLNFLILEINGALLAQSWSIGDPGSVSLYKLVTALNNQGKWAAVWTALSGQPVTAPAMLEFKSAMVVRMQDALYNIIQTVTGYSKAQMTALWATANALPNP